MDEKTISTKKELRPTVGLHIIVALALSLSVIVGVLILSIEKTDGILTYALDDAYIHMAIARNFIASGSWGISPESFSSSTSSPLWTGLIAVGFWLTDGSIAVPLILNTLVAGALLVFLILSAPAVKVQTSLASLSIFFLSPGIALVFSGMEHLTHTLIVLIIAFSSKRVLEKIDNVRWVRVLVLTSLIAPLVRYESLFVVAAAAVCLFFANRRKLAVTIATVAWIPVVAYGLISLSQGWKFFPSSLLLKTGAASSESIGFDLVRSHLSTAYWNMRENPGLFIIAVFTSVYSLIMFLKNRCSFTPLNIIPAIFVLAYSQHIFLAQLGWFYRYEAYLVVLGLFSIVLLSQHTTGISARVKVSSVLLFTVTVALLAIRAGKATWETPLAIEDRYLEHYTQAEFVSEYYPNGTLVVNDIGMLAYYCPDVKLLDMYGLGSLAPYEFRHERDGYTSSDLANWANEENADLAILKPEWWAEVFNRIPGHWIPVGAWETPRNVVFSDSTVLFLALNESQAEVLDKNLQSFATYIPRPMDYKKIPWKRGVTWDEWRFRYSKGRTTSFSVK